VAIRKRDFEKSKDFKATAGLVEGKESKGSTFDESLMAGETPEEHST
jgi:hypothetical protein